MFMNDVHKKEEIKNIATQHLRKYGIKYRPKKPRQNLQVNNNKYGRKFFKVPLQNLDTQTVTLEDGRQLVLPKLVHEMCSFILTKVNTEGIFRKEGSKSRQNEIKLSIDRGCLLGDDHHVIDVAVVLKSFLRELPEPLIPSSYHELFLRCSLVEGKLQAILLACLLLPTEHLNVLSYLMQFFSQVASHCDSNKMNVGNLAIVIGPNVFPIDEKVAPKSQHILTKTCDIIKIMIDNSRTIGVIPEYIIEQIGSLSANEAELNEKRKKKRRSGSLTRMFNGLKKIVSSKAGEESSSNIVTPDLLLTPSINRSVKKRKAEVNGLSTKKKKDLLSKLPEAALLNTPFTPHRTPISGNPNPKDKCVNPQPNNEVEPEEIPKEKKLQWYMRSRSVKSLKDDEEVTKRRNSVGPKTMLERRWSAVSQQLGRKKKRNSCNRKENATTTLKNPIEIAEKPETTESDYVKVSKAEYEEIKNRVTAIERRISIELENVQCQVTDEENKSNKNNREVDEDNKSIKSVQTAYEQTLVQTEPLSPTTDQLARRLSRELRIRRTSEQKIIRSPSARKIGSMRRRSREIEKNNAKLNRNQSWHVNSTAIIPRVNLKRGKPNTLFTGLPTPTKTSLEASPARNTPQTSANTSGRVTRSSSLHIISNGPSSSNNSNHWVSGEGFFSTLQTPRDFSDQVADRASLAKLRSQNAGMVLAKAKLFDNLKDSDNSSSIKSENSGEIVAPRGRNTNKIGSIRNSDARMSYRVRALKLEERRMNKKSMSPRRRNGANLSHRQRLQAAKQIVDLQPKNKENCCDDDFLPSQMDVDVSTPKRTPKNVPHIKKSITVKSPKRLCRTPQNLDRKTPLKVLATPMYKL